jgi:hypothetical protein
VLSVFKGGQHTVYRMQVCWRESRAKTVARQLMDSDCSLTGGRWHINLPTELSLAESWTSTAAPCSAAGCSCALDYRGF